jgi:glycerophosphoryl diester phosphodiesterase
MDSLFSKIAEGRTLNIAHRGARSLAPENTLSAALRALQAGADLWELDVAMTADGVPIVVHDGSLQRTSNAEKVFSSRRPWRVHEFTLDQIRRLDFGSWFAEKDPFGQIAAGMVSPESLRCYGDEKAPTLGEALQFTLAHDWFVNIEIKDLRGTPGDYRIVEKVLTLIEDLEIGDRVIISSFNQHYLNQVKAINHLIPTGILVDRPHLNPVSLVQDLRADAYHPLVSALTIKDLRLMREKGIAVFVWTVNEEATMRSLIEKRVSGIFTDFPQRLQSILDSPGNS